MTYLPKEQDLDDWNRPLHGSRARYRKGCRCSRCTAAERRYRKDYRLRRYMLEAEMLAALNRTEAVLLEGAPTANRHEARAIAGALNVIRGEQLKLEDALGTFQVRLPRPPSLGVSARAALR